MADRYGATRHRPARPRPPGPARPGDLGAFAGYWVVRRLGQGGMGVVYRAIDPTLGRPVALKIMLPDLAATPASRERFVREARALAAVADDHVVAVYQVGEAAGFPFLTMEYLSGLPLDRYARGRTVPVSEAVLIARQVAVGLAAIHAAGLVHRDLKPANVWLDSRTRRARVLDFGLAVEVAGTAPMTLAGTATGTPGYMAPEQAAGHPIDHRADLFALGVILYQLVTGQVPFPGRTVSEILAATTVRTPWPVGALRPDAPAPLVALIDRLLAKPPADRPASAAAVAAELDRLGGGGPAWPAGPSPWDEVAAPRRRWGRVAAAAVAAAAVGLGAAAVVSGRLATADRPAPAGPGPAPAISPDAPTVGRQGYTALFSGTDLTGWHTPAGQPGAPGGWAAHDGVLVGTPDPDGGPGRVTRWLVSDRAWADADYRVEYRWPKPGGEGGLGLRLPTDRSDPENTVLLVSLIDDEGFDKVHGLTVLPNYRTGTVQGFDLVPPPQNAPIGGWNRLRVMVRGTTVRTWHNDRPGGFLDLRVCGGIPDGYRRAEGAVGLRAFRKPLEVRSVEVRTPPPEE